MVAASPQPSSHRNQSCCDAPARMEELVFRRRTRTKCPANVVRTSRAVTAVTSSPGVAFTATTRQPASSHPSSSSSLSSWWRLHSSSSSKRNMLCEFPVCPQTLASDRITRFRFASAFPFLLMPQETRVRESECVVQEWDERRVLGTELRQRKQWWRK